VMRAEGRRRGPSPVVVTDACGAGNPEAAERSVATLRFAGGSLEAQSATICSALASS
jgi:hypothetical protein